MVIKVKCKIKETETKTTRAIQWTGKNEEEIIMFCGNCITIRKDNTLFLNALPEFIKVNEGDYLIETAHGALFNVSSDTFETVYDILDDYRGGEK